MALLQEYKTHQAADAEKLGNLWNDTDRLFTAWNGTPMHPNSPLTWLTKFCEANNLKKVNVHSFRHLNASLLITAGIDARTVSASLGHSQTSTTLNIYAHTFAQAQAKASEAIAEALPFEKKKSR